MSLLYDQHLHSFHSIDSETPPAENVKAALGAGLGGLVFTEHFDSHPDEWDTCRYDDDIYSRDIAELRSLFQDQIFIGKGIEICYQPSRWEFILEHLSAHTFDLVILSVHWSETGPIQYRQWWEQFPTVHDAADEYLRTVLKAVSDAERAAGELGRRVFDVLGHLDLVKRYALFIAGTEDVQVDPVLLDDILLTCIQADLTPEVNTSLLRQGGSEPMPGFSIMQRYRELGGSTMSLGSDAHRAEDVGADFAVATGLMKEAGLRGIALFRSREKQEEYFA